MKIVNQTVPMALSKLGYSEEQVREIVEHIDEQETIEGAPHLEVPITWRCSTVPSSRSTASARFTTWATSR